MMTPVHNIQYMDMPTTVHSFVKSNPDDSYTIFINARLSNDGRLKAYNHELHHIENGDYDYDNLRDLNQIELEAHAAAATAVLPEPDPSSDQQPARKKHRRRKTSVWKKRRNAMRALGISIDPWDQHERNWLDPDRSVY